MIVQVEMRPIHLRLETNRDNYEGVIRNAIENDALWDAWIASFVGEISGLDATVVGHRWFIEYLEEQEGDRPGRPSYYVVDSAPVGPAPDGAEEP